MKVLISLIFFSLAFSVFAEDVVIIELHNQEIDQMLLNASSDKDDKKNDINNEELTNSNSIIEEDVVINSEESDSSEAIMAFPDFWENADKDELLFLLDNLLITNSSSLNNGIFLGTKSPPSGAKLFKKTSLNEKIFCVFLVLIYSIPSISTEF